MKKGDGFRADKDFDRILFASRENADLLLAEGEEYSVTLRYTPKYPVRRGDRAAYLAIRAPGYSGRLYLYAQENRRLPRKQMAFSWAMAFLCLLLTAYYFRSRA